MAIDPTNSRINLNPIQLETKTTPPSVRLPYPSSIQVKEPPASLKGRVSLGAVNQGVNYQIEMDPKEAVAFIKRNSSTERKGPVLIHPDDPKRALIDKLYKISITAEKQAYRDSLINKLKQEWASIYNEKTANELALQFHTLASRLENDGVGVFGDLVSKGDFLSFIDKYTILLKEHGNGQWLHSFCDLRGHPEFLYDNSFNKSYFHPLLLTLVSYHMGGPIRVNDARAKDTGVQVVKTLDSMCHIDNVPFTKEVKLTIFWKTGEPIAPKGQCFACIPGTQKTPRAYDGLMEDGKIAYTTEAGSVFRTEEELDGALNAQEAVRKEGAPLVIGLREGDEVVTAIAETGGMVHHRWRVEGGEPRSCLLLSFHLIEDDKGELVTKQKMEEMKKYVDGNALSAFVLGDFSENKDEYSREFFNAIDESVAKDSADLLNALKPNSGAGSKVFTLDRFALDASELSKWRNSVLEDPGMTEIKNLQNIMPLNTRYTKEAFINNVCKLMEYDKTGVLELILYSDGREEKRKWARNQIRELKNTSFDFISPKGSPPSLHERIKGWELDIFTKIQGKNLLEKEKLSSLASNLESIARTLELSKVRPTDELSPKMAINRIYPSIRQLIGDLSIAIVNCSNPECFLSTSLFLFWSADTLMRVTKDGPEKEAMREIGSAFIKHYIALNAATEFKRALESPTIDDFNAPAD